MRSPAPFFCDVACATFVISISRRFGPPPVLDPALISFARTSLRSIWTLEILLFIRERGGQAVAQDVVVRELRATASLVGEALNRLASAGMVQQRENGDAYFAPASAGLAALCTQLDRANRERPIALREAILTSTPLPAVPDGEVPGDANDT